MSVIARLEPNKLSAEQELAALLAQGAGDGAAVIFVGFARPCSTAGRPVDLLVLEHHSTLTQLSLEEIAAGAAQQFDVSHVRVAHRCGEIPAGAPVVFVGAMSQHRRSAFDAADYLMDRLKTEAVFWKMSRIFTSSRLVASSFPPPARVPCTSAIAPI